MQLIPIASRLPGIYSRISTIFPDQPWIEIVEKIEQTRRAFPMRVGQAEVDNWLAFGLTRWERQRNQVSTSCEWKTLVEAMMLADRVSDLCKAVREGRDGPRDLEQRFLGAIRNPADARAIHFELYMAKLLEARNCKIAWPVESSGKETFDLLVQPPKDLPEFELECKSFSGDKGVLVGLSDGQRLLEACLRTADVNQCFPSHPGIASVMTVNVTDEIPTDERKLASLATDIITTLKGEKRDKSAIFEIVHTYCPIIGNPDDTDACFNAAARLPGGTLAFVSFGSNQDGWKGFRVAWAGKITLWKKAETVAKDALDKQLTKTRPGVVALQFTNDTAESILTANESKNKYRMLSEKLFTRDHAASIVIAGDIEVRPIIQKIPYAPEAFMGEFCRFAAFDNTKGMYRGSNLKRLFG